jgi:predicted AAA+ superfamily ATPase
VQNIVGWEKAILSLQNKGKDIYITWSNSKLLSWELATNLRWRYIEFEVFPFDYKEFLEALNLTNKC